MRVDQRGSRARRRRPRLGSSRSPRAAAAAAAPARSSTSPSIRGSATRPTPASSATCSRSSSATRSSTRTSPSRSPGRASRPARSTPSSRTGATPTSQDLHHRQEGRASTPGSTGVDGIIGWYVRRGWPTEYPDITDWNNLNKYADLFKTSESGDKGQFLAGDPSFVTNDEAIITDLELELQGRLRRQRGRPHRGVPARPSRTRRRSSATSTRRSGSSTRSPLVKVNLPPWTEGCDADPENDHLRLRAVHAARTRSSARTSRTRRRRPPSSSRTSQWTAEDQNAVAELHHQRGHDRARTPPRSGSTTTRRRGSRGSRAS